MICVKGISKHCPITNENAGCELPHSVVARGDSRVRPDGSRDGTAHAGATSPTQGSPRRFSTLQALSGCRRHPSGPRGELADFVCGGPYSSRCPGGGHSAPQASLPSLRVQTGVLTLAAINNPYIARANQQISRAGWAEGLARIHDVVAGFVGHNHIMALHCCLTPNL